MVSELVLLVPLLLRLRQPGADAARLGPAVEEENWSGLNGVAFQRFRETVQSFPDKRRRVPKQTYFSCSCSVFVTVIFFHRRILSLIQTHVSVAKEAPLVLMGWLSLVAIEDLPALMDLTEGPAEQLIQSLLYRLRSWAELRDSHRLQENLKVTKRDCLLVLRSHGV